MIVPSPLFTKVPSEGLSTIATVAGLMVPSKSVSLNTTSMVIGVSSAVVLSVIVVCNRRIIN